MLKEILPLVVSVWAPAALLALVVSAAVVDVRLKKIPNWLTYPAILIGVVANTWAGWSDAAGRWSGLAASLAGFAVGFVPLLLAWLAGGIGGGDAKLMGAIGAIGGWKLAISALVYGFAVAALMAVIVMIRKRVTRRTLRRVWHTVVLLVTPGARPADPTSKDSPTIPFAVALCVGTLAAMLEILLRAGS